MMENFKASLKNLSKNKIHLILIGLAAIILATVLIYAYVEFTGTRVNFVPYEEGKPYCGAIGSRSEGWYINSDSSYNRPELIRWDNCEECYAVCKAIGTRSEGWYSSCDGERIKWDNCGEIQEEKCGIENCHGLDITCGPNIPDMCAEIWMVGDGCRKYAECKIINGKCQLVQNKKFEDCKSCVEKCSEDFKHNPIKLSQCAYKCAEAKEEITCNEKCKSLNYKSGICRMSCETWNNEVNIGYISDCNPPCPSGMLCAAVMYNCCCQKESQEDCAKEREHFSSVYGEYPDHCCEGLTEWHSGMDTRISVGDKCYGTGLVAGSPVGTCISCGNGICEDIEDVCNCVQDCKAGQNSDYATIKEFCESKKYNLLCVSNFDNPLRPSSLCQLCEEPEVKCTSEGERRHSDDLGRTFSPCCEGLVSIPDAVPGGEGICSFAAGAGDYCTKCGDGICKSPENLCNCPKDCKEDTPDCRDENYPCTVKDISCCFGLKEVLHTYMGSDGSCIAPLPCGSICRPCGNGICDTNENKCNCPEDCKEEETLSADLNCDGNVNLVDMAILLSFWEKDPSGSTSCKNPDINQDGSVNLADFSIIMSQWTK